jgi:Virulence protein
MTMTQWAEKLDAFLSFNEREVLDNPGKVQAKVAERLALERYEAFDADRRAREALEADKADLAEIERIGKELGER